MATKIISQGWQLSLPNDFLTDHSFSDGKYRETKLMMVQTKSFYKLMQKVKKYTVL